MKFLTTRIWTFFGGMNSDLLDAIFTQIIAWSRCFGVGRNMPFFGGGMCFVPRIAVTHTHMNGIFVRIGDPKKLQEAEKAIAEAAAKAEVEWFFQWRGGRRPWRLELFR